MISLTLLGIDALLVVAGTFQRWDRELAYRSWQLIGTSGVRVLEAPSFIGVSVHPSRDFSIAAAVAVLLVAAPLVVMGYRWSGLFVVVAVAGVSIAAWLLKVVVVRYGAPLTPWTPVGHSFPSGTAAAAVAFFGSIAYLSAQSTLDRTKARILVGCSMLLIVVYIASALTYHYPSEVIGGVAAGIGWLSLVLIVLWPALRTELSERPRIRPQTDSD